VSCANSTNNSSVGLLLKLEGVKCPLYFQSTNNDIDKNTSRYLFTTTDIINTIRHLIRHLYVRCTTAFIPTNGGRHLYHWNHLKNVVDFLTRPNTIKCATFSRRRHNISTNSRKMIFFRKKAFAYEIVHRRVLLDYGSWGQRAIKKRLYYIF